LSTSWQECGRILARTGALTGGIWTNEKRKKCGTHKLAAPLSIAILFGLLGAHVLAAIVLLIETNDTMVASFLS
jgi:hypothetical protein